MVRTWPRWCMLMLITALSGLHMVSMADMSVFVVGLFRHRPWYWPKLWLSLALIISMLHRFRVTESMLSHC